MPRNHQINDSMASSSLFLLFLFYKLNRIIIHILIICIYVFSCNVLYRQRTHSLFAIDQCCQSLLCSVLYRAFVLYRGRRSSIIFSVCNTFQDWRFCHIFSIFICCNKLCSKIIKIRSDDNQSFFCRFHVLIGKFQNSFMRNSFSRMIF